MKKITVLLAIFMAFSLTACGLNVKDLLEILNNAANQTEENSEAGSVNTGGNGAGAGNGSGNGAGGNGAGAGSGSSDSSEKDMPADGFDAEYTVVIGGSVLWSAFEAGTDTDFAAEDGSIVAISADTGSVVCTGLSVGDTVVTAEADGTQKQAKIKVIKREETKDKLWTLYFDSVSVFDLMGLAVVDYEVDLTATHTGADMFGEYFGSMGVSYDANLDGMAMILEATGGSVDYDADGWFVNDNFRMSLMPYDEKLRQDFADSYQQSAGEELSPEEQAILDAYMGPLLEQLTPELKDFEKNSKPVAMWYDWAFHSTDGDLSSYLDLNRICMGTFSGTSAVDESGTHVTGSADFHGLAIYGNGGMAVIMGPMHESFDYTEEQPFPYVIEVYEDGQAVLSFGAPDSPILIRLYGTLTSE